MLPKRELIIRKLADEILDDFIEKKASTFHDSLENIKNVMTGKHVSDYNNAIKRTEDNIENTRRILENKSVLKGFFPKKIKKLTPREINKILEPDFNELSRLEKIRNQEAYKTMGAHGIAGGVVGGGIFAIKKIHDKKKDSNKPYSYI
jgi:hypothetical protein